MVVVVVRFRWYVTCIAIQFTVVTQLVQHISLLHSVQLTQHLDYTEN